MHEMSLVEELLAAVRSELRAHPGAHVRTVRARIGTLRQVEPSTLEFCFDAATKDGPLTGTRLCIERIDAAARCRVCSLEFDVENNWFECPRCHAAGAELLRGDELQLLNIEIEEENAPAAR